LYGVRDQIRENLLQLHPIAAQPPQCCLRVGANQDVLILKLAAREHEHLLNNIIDIQCDHARFRSLHQGADASKNIGCTLSIFDHGPDRLARVIKIRDGIGQPVQAGLGVGHIAEMGWAISCVIDAASRPMVVKRSTRASSPWATLSSRVRSNYTLFQFLIQPLDFLLSLLQRRRFDHLPISVPSRDGTLMGVRDVEYVEAAASIHGKTD
jgi:hypothetical protein